MLLHGTNQFAAAKPVEKFFADSVRIDEMREFENSMGVVLSYQDRRPSCDLGSNRSDWNAKMSKFGVKFLSIRDGANLQLVDDARAFGSIGHAVLTATDNSHSLLRLAAIHPEIEGLTIAQTSSLSDDALLAIKKFRNLHYLDLSCPIHTPSLVQRALPESLVRLHVKDTFELPRLPLLRLLNIEECRVSKAYLENLDAPALAYLKFNWVDFLPESLAPLRKFKHLLGFYTWNCHIDTSELKNLKYNEVLGFIPSSVPDMKSPLRQFGNSGYLQISIRSSWKMVDLCLARADSLYRQKKYSEALRDYNYYVLCKPSAEAYLQRGRCLLFIGRSTEAMASCDIAASLNPNSPSIDSLRTQILTQRSQRK